MSSPTARSKALMEGRNYHVEIVERWIPGANIRKDLLGFGDLLCIHRETGDTVIVQTTSASNFSARINKIATHENLGLARKAGWGILVHGWRKQKGRYVCREEDVS